MSLYSAPGSDGILPADFAAWRHGVTYTVHPRLLSPVQPDEEYRINVTVRRTYTSGPPATNFGALYARASVLTAARAKEVQKRWGHPVASWLLARAWFVHELRGLRIMSATVTWGVMLAVNRAVPGGVAQPTEEELYSPSGGTAEAFVAVHDRGNATRLDEFYTEFGAADSSARDVTLSYGEYGDCAPRDYELILRRGEALRKFYVREMCASAERVGAVVMREWFGVDTGKSGQLNHLATVNLYMR